MNRCRLVTFDGTEAWRAASAFSFTLQETECSKLEDFHVPTDFTSHCEFMCNQYKPVPLSEAFAAGEICAVSMGASGNAIILMEDEVSTLASFKEKLAEMYAAGNPLQVIIPLVNVTETPLDADTLNAYNALHTIMPNTTIYTDSNAVMDVVYAADTKTYIDNKFEELAAAIVANT